MSHQGTLSTYSYLKSRVNKALKELGFTDIKIGNNYYYFSGFATAPSGQVIYLSSVDMRDVAMAKRLGSFMGVLVRTANDYKDYSGGRNTYTQSDEYDRIFNHLKQFV